MTVEHKVRVYRSEENLARADQLAWKIAEVAADRVSPPAEVADMVVNRVVDNAGVATASLNRRPVVAARAQALRHAAPQDRAGAVVFGTRERVSPEWAAWANGVAVRELDFHDTFLAADYSHPGDNIPPLLAVAQHTGADGAALTRAIAVAYEVQVALVTGICLHQHKIDHVAHLGPSVAAGIGALLDLPTEVTYQAVQQALHTTTATRQSRKGEISSWKAFAPRSRGRSRSRPPTARCSARARRRRSTRVRTVSSPGCSTARTPRTPFRCRSAGRHHARSCRPTPRSTPRSTRARR